MSCCTPPRAPDLATFARSRGVRLAIEMHARQLVFNVATMLRLREEVDPEVVGANLHPSHLMWQGADILAVIRASGPAIFHVHAKDARVDAQNAAINGVLDTLPPDRAQERPWNYVTLGLGHAGGANFWARFAYALAPSDTTGH